MADLQGVVEQIKLKQQMGQPLTQDEQVLAGLTPEQLQKVMQLNELQEKRDALRDPSGKMGMGQELIDQKMPDHGTVGLSSGTSFHRGPTKADYMADAIRKGVGAYMVGQGKKRDTKLMGKQTVARNYWANAALKQAQDEAAQRSGVPASIVRPGAPAALAGQPSAPQYEPTLEEKLRKWGVQF
jgi:hypothetical protein